MMHSKNIKTSGQSLKDAKKVLIMIHGRGAGAEDILRLAPHLHLQDYALMAPQATNSTWYPFSFLADPAQNEPWLSSALTLLKELVTEITDQRVATENIYFLGFSQGACLSLEFVTRNATRYGGVVALTGGLIGDRIYGDNYAGDFQGTPVFLSTGDPDPHVPLKRVEESQGILEKLNAAVNVKVYENRPHTISQDEIDLANQFIFKQ